MTIPNAQLIRINFHYNDKPDEPRNEYAYIQGDKAYDQESEEPITVGEITVEDNEVFYFFDKEESIVGDLGEFTVTSYEEVGKNGPAAPKP